MQLLFSSSELIPAVHQCGIVGLQTRKRIKTNLVDSFRSVDEKFYPIRVNLSQTPKTTPNSPLENFFSALSDLTTSVAGKPQTGLYFKTKHETLTISGCKTKSIAQPSFMLTDSVNA